MKKISLLALTILLASSLWAQKQVFDVVSFTIPQGWSKTEMTGGMQLSTKNDGSGKYAAAIILKAVATTATAPENFTTGWEKLVKGTVTVSGTPTMQDPATEKGWTIISGQASYTDGADKGLVTLITATGNGKMANVVIMTNGDKFQKQIGDFIASLDLNETADANQAAPTTSATAQVSNKIYSITVPPTWTLNAAGNSLTIEKNTNVGKRIVEFMNPVQSSGNLEKDMEHIFFEVFDGWSLYGGANNLLFEKGNHEKGVTAQGLPYYMLSNSIQKAGGNGDVIKATVLLIQVGPNVAVINTADQILGSESEMALNFLLFTLKLKGVAEKPVDYKQQLVGTWGAASGTYGNSLSAVTTYTPEGKTYVLVQSSRTVGYDYYNDLIKKKQFSSQGVFSFKGNVLERKTSSGSTSRYFIRFYSTKYGNYEWQNVMGLYNCDYDKTRIEQVFPFKKI